MSYSDTVAEFLTRIRNGLMAKHRFIDIGWSKMRVNLAQILKDEGYVENFIVKKEGSIGTVRVFLKYSKGQVPVIQKIKRVSRPGCRRYIGSEEITPVFGGMGISILSTSKGVMTGHKARQNKVGGEFLCTVW